MEKIGIAEKKMDFSYKHIQYKMRCNIKTYSNHMFNLKLFHRNIYVLTEGTQPWGKNSCEKSRPWSRGVEPTCRYPPGNSHILVLKALLSRWFSFSQTRDMDLFPERVTVSFQMFGQISTKLSPWLLRMKWRTPGNWASVHDTLT